MTDDKPTSIPELSAEPPDRSAASAIIPLSTRLAHEIPKPRDWQHFQRGCVVLYRAELNDPHAQEYGRVGQKQRGIDVLGIRDGDPDHYVGVQCKVASKPLSKTAIMKECRAALELVAGLKEIIFATTAPDSTHATNAAIEVQRSLRKEGHDLKVVIFGWGNFQTLIALHDTAYAFFFPSIVATSAPQASVTTPLPSVDLVNQIASGVAERLLQKGVALAPGEADATGSTDEDPALHAKINAYRDLFKEQRHPQPAEKGLLELLEKESLDGKPWARFRIETNLGSIALDLGREAEAVERFETAHTVRPDDPKALANLALARTIQGRFKEAMDLAREALGATPRADYAVAYLLQAAARSKWQGDPETLIPADLVGNEHADLGLAEFLRRRDAPGWAERSLEISRRHAGVEVFKQISAIAVLALASETSVFLLGGISPVTLDDLNRAADDMKALAEHRLEVDFEDEHDLVASLNNAAMLLRLSGRSPECEALIKRALPRVPHVPSLLRLLALSQIEDGRRVEALATLKGAADDAENQLLSAELIAVDDPTAAIAQAMAIDAKTLGGRLNMSRWRMIGEHALRTDDSKSLKAAVAGLRALDASSVSAGLLEIRGEHKDGLGDNDVQERLLAIAAALPPDADMATRFDIAGELGNQDLPGEAAALLEDIVDLERLSPATILYLNCLAAARRDEAFRKALVEAAPEVRDDPGTLWMAAGHAWNVGDLQGSLREVDKLLEQQPDNPQARLLKIEILIRQDRSAEVLAELDKPIEHLSSAQLKDRFRVAMLLGHFGYVDRAAAFAYRLFLEHRDNSQAWMALSLLVLEEGRGEADVPSPWDVAVVAPNVAVDIRYDDGEEKFLVIEPDPRARNLDEDSWEPAHPLIGVLTGLAGGASFIDQNGRAGKISKIRHKYVARLHFVLERFESRFPTSQGFRKVPVDVEKPGGLDALIAELKARREWIEHEQEQYINRPWSLGVLAHRLRLDVIEVAGGLARHGIHLKVAMGNEPERNAAARAVRENKRKGCVLDLLAFWTAWQLKSLDAIIATAGTVHLTQSVIDRLRARRARIDDTAKEGLKTMTYEDGKIAISEVAPEVVVEWRDEVDLAIAWAVENATICPLVVKDDLPPALREHLRTGRFDIFDSIVLAIQTNTLLVTDDLPTREFYSLVSEGGVGAWLHKVFVVALDQKRIDLDTYITWTANLVEAGHNYIGISGLALARALRIDAEAGQAPGYHFKTLCKVIGGKSAEPKSHIAACEFCLRDIWRDNTTSAYRQPATSLLLSHLLHERFDDYGPILRILLKLVQRRRELVDYIRGWARGHFLSEALVDGEKISPTTAAPRRRKKRR